MLQLHDPRIKRQKLWFEPKPLDVCSCEALPDQLRLFPIQCCGRPVRSLDDVRFTFRFESSVRVREDFFGITRGRSRRFPPSLSIAMQCAGLVTAVKVGPWIHSHQLQGWEFFP